MSENECSSHSEESDSDFDDSSEEETPLIRIPCNKLNLQEHLKAYFGGVILVRDEESVPCESKLAETVVTNYIIAKRILSNVCWQEKFLCKNVCTTWWSAIKSLARERLNPVDFIFTASLRPKLGNGIFTISDEFYNEPVAVLTFVNTPGLVASLKCKDISPSVCKPECEITKHSALDVIQQIVCAPKNCMLTVEVDGISYLPLANSDTELQSPDNPNMVFPFLSGISIPVIPGVKFHVLNITQRKENSNNMDLKKEFYDKVDKIAEDQIIKGALVFVTEKYILQSVQDVLMLNYLKEVQSDEPYALGGCLIKETISKEEEMDALINCINENDVFHSKTFISVALFTIPKIVDQSEQRDKCNFDMFSVVIHSSEWVKDKIKNVIDEFAKRVPRFEHSVAFKLSCVGRDKKHMLEQELFRNAFPNTPILGCYGNGELGINHPPRAPPAPPADRRKRPKPDDKNPSLMYSYSTVFVYLGWGNIAAGDVESPKK